MTRYASFDSTAIPPAPVTGWYDTGLFTYPSLPPDFDLLEIDDDTFWDNRMTGLWGVTARTFVNITPTPSGPTELQQQAMAALAAGIVLTSLSTGALDGTYDVSLQTTTSMSSVVAGIGAGLGLPGGASTFNWPDTSGSSHAFTETNFKNFATAVTGYTYTLNQIIGGAILPLPDFNLTIA